MNFIKYMETKKIKHNCQFIQAADINSRGILGVVCVCAICGEVREVYRSGEIVIVNKAWEKITK